MPNYNANALYGNDGGYYFSNNQRQPQGYIYPQPPSFNSYANNNLLNNSPYNNYMGINNNTQNQQRHNIYLKCRPVSSEEEARASQIDLDGSLWVFTDVGNKKIYTKQVDANGLSVFNVYTLDAETQIGNPTQAVPKQANNQEQPQYITKEEFNKAIVTLTTAIKELQKPATAATQTLLDFK